MLYCVVDLFDCYSSFEGTLVHIGHEIIRQHVIGVLGVLRRWHRHGALARFIHLLYCLIELMTFYD